MLKLILSGTLCLPFQSQALNYPTQSVIYVGHPFTATLVSLLQNWPENPAPAWWIDFLRSVQAVATEADAFGVFQTMLAANPTALQAFEKFIFGEIDRRSHFSLFAEAGLTRDTAFIGELLRRLGNRILPPAPDPFELADLVGAICRDRKTAHWLRGISLENWQALFEFLQIQPPEASPLRGIFRQSLQHSVLLLVQRIASLGTEPEISQHLPSLERYHSPFTRLGAETNRFLDLLEDNPEEAVDSLGQIKILRAYCERSLVSVHREQTETGVSLRSVALLTRLEECLARYAEMMIFFDPTESANSTRHGAGLMRHLLESIVAEQSVSEHWKRRTERLALRIVEHNSHSGEHYISRTRGEFWKLLNSALGGGLITAATSILKVLINSISTTPVATLFLQSTNYVGSFLAIQFCNFTLATKQPAMTASALAHALDHRQNGNIDVVAARALVTQIFRSQIISVLGNLGAVIPVTLLLDFLWKFSLGHSLCSQSKALHLLEANHPWQSATAWYAIITGGCLFLSGIVSGYFDNLVDCWHFGERVKAHPGLQRWVGEDRLKSYAGKLQRNLGSMAGNIFLGISLAALPFLGQISGLPLDVRHVTLGTGNLMLAISSLQFHLTTQQYVGVVLGILLIGVINLMVSFGLSLAIAARSRGNKSKLLRGLLYTALRDVLRSPKDFFYPRPAAPLELPGVDKCEG